MRKSTQTGNKYEFLNLLRRIECEGQGIAAHLVFHILIENRINTRKLLLAFAYFLKVIQIGVELKFIEGSQCLKAVGAHLLHPEHGRFEKPVREFIGFGHDKSLAFYIVELRGHQNQR